MTKESLFLLVMVLLIPLKAELSYMRDECKQEESAQFQQQFSLFLSKSSLWVINYKSMDIVPISMNKVLFPVFWQEKEQYYLKKVLKKIFLKCEQMEVFQKTYL